MVMDLEENPSRSESHRLGPHGLGDPDDRTLRKVEAEVMIPKKMREKARKEKCFPEVEEFNKCCRESGLSLVYKCQEENGRMKDCLARWYNDKEFQGVCKEEYLQERALYRRTGLTQKQRSAQNPTTLTSS